MGNHGPHHLFLGQTQLHCWGIGCDDDIVDLLSRRFNLSCTPPPSSSSTSPSWDVIRLEQYCRAFLCHVPQEHGQEAPEYLILWFVQNRFLHFVLRSCLEIGDCKVRQRDGSELQSCSRRMLLERLLGKQFWPESNYGHKKII
ncbi:hypothetical protein PVAP13_1NG486000 [Panicum virgatum]|uniref:Uncharacterized protein n=1 Tax=Panicum virgatum TaxID=38727 RepID=A0A8T0WXR1_PANVG|nr:hypothetical protein PVAP13_1NG486000 [Panicum virgatum]